MRYLLVKIPKHQMVKDTFRYLSGDNGIFVDASANSKSAASALLRGREPEI